MSIPKRISGQQLIDGVARYKQYFADIKKTFVARDEVIDLIMFAMLQRAHCLLFGPPGTTKTALESAIFAGINNGQKFNITFTMFMDDTALFGPYNVKEMRETGILEHVTEHMLPEAHFARFGEFLDANLPLLRSTLDALEERMHRRGRQIIEMPLLTVLADTNVDPGEYLKKNPHAWAVLSRIQMIAKTEYVELPEQMSRIVQIHQNGGIKAQRSTIPLSLVHDLSELVVFPPSLIDDEMIYKALGNAYISYRTQRQKLIESGLENTILPDISDRRFAHASQMAEVSAVLEGRTRVIPDDMFMIGHAIGTTLEEHRLWEEIVREQIEWIAENKPKQLDHAQLVAIDMLMQQAQQLDITDHAEAIPAFKLLHDKLAEIEPDTDEVRKKKSETELFLSEVRNRLESEILQQSGLPEAS